LEIKKECILEHEMYHQQSKNSNCPPDDCGPTTSGEFQNTEEIAAYTVQIQCLSGLELPACMADQDCFDYIDNEIDAAKNQIAKYQKREEDKQKLKKALEEFNKKRPKCND
jgi:benzoyl-CoA reductase/2-hydroxyglutaryl-CoA dehydratase subunit BcrC/BadD/HgdB